MRGEQIRFDPLVTRRGNSSSVSICPRPLRGPEERTLIRFDPPVTMRRVWGAPLIRFDRSATSRRAGTREMCGVPIRFGPSVTMRRVWGAPFIRFGLFATNHLGGLGNALDPFRHSRDQWRGLENVFNPFGAAGSLSCSLAAPQLPLGCPLTLSFVSRPAAICFWRAARTARVPAAMPFSKLCWRLLCRMCGPRTPKGAGREVPEGTGNRPEGHVERRMRARKELRWL